MKPRPRTARFIRVSSDVSEPPELRIAAIENLDWTLSEARPYTQMRRLKGSNQLSISEAKSQVALLHQISNIVSSNVSLEKMLQELIGLAVDVTSCDACLVYLVDHTTREIVLRASQ